MNNDSASKESVTTALIARIHALDLGPDQGLSELGDKTDPESVLRRLQILISAERYEDAATSVEKLAPDSRWCDKAILVCTAVGDIARADELVDWSNDIDLHRVRQRCVLQYAKGVFRHIGLKTNGKLVKGRLCDSNSENLNRVLEVLSRITRLVEANSRIENPLEEEGVGLAATAAWLLDRMDTCRRLASYLQVGQKISEHYIRLVSVGAIEASPDLPKRIRADFPTNLDMQICAVRIESQILGDEWTAFSCGLKIAQDCTTPDPAGETRFSAQDIGSDDRHNALKEDLFWLLRDLSERLGGRSKSEVNILAPELLANRPSAKRLHKALTFLSMEQPEEAERELQQGEDNGDPVWLQADAQRLLQQGDSIAAYGQLISAARIVQDNGGLWQWAATVAFKAGELSMVEDALRSMLKVKPDSEDARRNLGVVLLKQGRRLDAARCFEELRSIKVEYAFEAIRNYALGGDAAHALKLTTELVNESILDDFVMFWHSELLSKVGRQRESLEFLKKLKDRFWESPGFIHQYMKVAFAAGEDGEGEKGLARLHELREHGRLPKDVLVVKTVDEFVHDVREGFKRTCDLQEDVVRGRLPWLTVDHFRGYASLWAWRERTKELEWLNEVPHARGAYTVYATNRYSIGRSDDVGAERLAPVFAEKRGGAVVVDLSALLTLDRLGLLETAAEYFDRLIVPACYWSRAFEELERLSFHQVSRKFAVESLKNACDSGQIKVVSEAVVDDEWIVCALSGEQVVPYCANSVHLVVALQSLLRAGQISEALYDKFRLSGQGVDLDKEYGTPLSKGARLISGVDTLVELGKLGCLDEFLSFFRVFVGEDGRDGIYATHLHFAALDETRGWHKGLWEWIRESEKFDVATVPGRDVEEGEADVGLAASRISEARKIPLFVDDRVLQVSRQREADGNSTSAFGTDAFLDALWDEDLLTIEELTDKYLTLMKRRYRFLVPPVKVIVECGKRYKLYPPGKCLEAVADYLHDCMRDPGLFSGAERERKPRSIATHLATEWVGLSARFIAEVWRDEDFSDASAEELTRWVALRMLPSIPHGIVIDGFEFASNLKRGLPALAVFNGASRDGLERVSKGLGWMASALGFTKAEIEDIGMGVIATHSLNGDRELETIFAKLVTSALLGDRDEIERKHFLLMKLAGLLRDDSLPKSDDEVFEHFKKEPEAEVPSHSEGPLVFIHRERRNAEVFSIADALLSADESHRSLILDHVESIRMRRADSVCLTTVEILQSVREDVSSASERVWIPRTLEAVEVLRRDFLLNLSGLEQSFQYYFDDGVNEYLKRVLLPELEGINGLPIEFLQASEQSSVISMRLHQIAVEESSIQQVLDRYFECFGHLPLDSQFGVGAVVENWSALGEGRCVEPEELWAWAEGRNSPLARFHVCQILCARLGSLSESTARRFWTEVNSIVLAGTSAESDGTEGSEQWVLYYLLAQHYCRLIELQNWCSRGEVVASIASWLADRVTTTFIENDGDIENVLPQLQEIYFSRVFDQWAVIRPAVEPSLFRYVTINVRNAWGLALLGHLGRVSQGDEAIIQELGKSEVMLKALVGNLWHAYPFGQEDEPIYAFTPMSILSLSEKLAELDSEEYSVQLNKFMLGRISEISDVKVLCEKLLNLDTENETDSAILFHGLTYLLSTERKSLDLLGSALDSIQEWSKAALLGLPTEHMDTVFEGLCELLGKGDPVRLNRPSWFYELPHVICEACMDSVEDEKKRRTLFFMLLTVCVKTDTVSALERIMQSEVRSSLADEISQWKRKFEHICIYGSSAVAARLRGVLCALDR